MSKIILLLLILLVVVASCGTKYLAVIDQDYQGKTIPPANFLVMPIQVLEYEPPRKGPCMFFYDPNEERDWQPLWNEKLKAGLAKKFPNQKFFTLGEDVDIPVRSVGSIHDMYALGHNNNRAEMVNIMAPGVEYIDLEPDAKAAVLLKYLNDTLKIDYVILFLKPKLKGEIEYSTNVMAGPGGSMTATTTAKTVYTADVIVQLWDCKNGGIILSSGGYKRGGSSCFFKSPQETSIEGATDDVMDKLKLLVAAALNRRYSHEVAFR